MIRYLNNEGRNAPKGEPAYHSPSTDNPVVTVRDIEEALYTQKHMVADVLVACRGGKLPTYHHH